MKPPATVWVRICGGVTHLNRSKIEAERWKKECCTIHRYRLDTPKPRKAKRKAK